MSATHHQLRPIITSRPIHSLPEAPYCLSPCSEVPELDASDYFTSDKLCFPKFPIAPSSSSVFAATSTDSDAPSTSHENDGYCSPASRLPRSPSLLSSLFQSQPASAVSSAAPSRHNSTTGTCSTRASTGLATPLSPISATPLPLDALTCTTGEQGQEGSRRKIAFACAPTTRDCKPILRKFDAASTSTSASEDNGGYRSARGLGLVGMGDKKCALTFAVKPYYPPGTFARSTSQSSTIPRDDQAGPSRRARSRSPSYIADCEWDDIRTPEAEELEESDDEGYEEDEEGGFTDDEDELGTFAAQGSRSNRFTWSRRPSFIPSSHHTLTATPRRRVPVETYCTTDDNYPEPIRGRKISIAARTTDKCSRHLSPPPRSPSPDSAPPAARSPSARDLCMRRDKAKGPRDPSEAAQGWKSDSAFMGMGSRAERMGIGAEGLVQARKASLPGQAECKSILRCSVPPASPSVVQSVQRRTASPRSTIDLSPLPSPKYSFHRPPLSPSSASLCTVNSNCATSVSEACGDARSGLQLALGGAA